MEWLTVDRMRLLTEPRLGKVLLDIESHMPAKHAYYSSDKVTWAHETTHGINSRLRNSIGKPLYNAFYCLEDRGISIPEPSFKLSDVAAQVPRALVGGVYDLYLIRTGPQYWNSRPLYILDEWVAYTNGTLAGLDLYQKGLWDAGPRLGTLKYMLEFSIYTLCLIATHKDTPNQDLLDFIRWNQQRVLQAKADAKDTPFADSGADAYWDKYLNLEDTRLRDLSNQYWGGAFEGKEEPPIWEIYS